MVKKYLIRVIGALCILGALALMFMPGWVTLDGISRRDLRNIRSDIDGVFDAALDDFTHYNEHNDAFTDELKDCDLPHTRSSIKSRFKEVTHLTEELLDDTVSLQELLTVSIKAPGMMTDMENLLSSRKVSSAFFGSAAEYILYVGTQATGEEYDSEVVGVAADELEKAAEDGLDVVSEISPLFVLLAGVLILILALGVAAAALHICNKGRWVKYLFLSVLVVLVAGSCVAFPMASGILADSLDDMSAFEDLALQITVTPFIAVALAIVPIVLDIIFERKKRNTIVEVVTDGK